MLRKGKIILGIIWKIYAADNGIAINAKIGTIMNPYSIEKTLQRHTAQYKKLDISPFIIRMFNLFGSSTNTDSRCKYDPISNVLPTN